MNTLIKSCLYAAVIAGSLLSAGCVRRTTSEGSLYPSETTQRNPSRGAPVIHDQTYWIWQGGFWNPNR